MLVMLEKVSDPIDSTIDRYTHIHTHTLTHSHTHISLTHAHTHTLYARMAILTMMRLWGKKTQFPMQKFTVIPQFLVLFYCYYYYMQTS